MCINFNLLQVIAAEGEKKASRALREASEIISESPAALQLRYSQVISFYGSVLFINGNGCCFVKEQKVSDF